jgi:nitroimidazol reductase NimA-like FMN-containing flavoprotein (pyridoxamine 5'-phosphate oxidase superfamily)
MSTPTPPAEPRLEELSHDECVKRLRSTQLGRIGFLYEGNVEVRPVNYRFHEGTVVLRTAYETVLDHIDGQDVVFEIDEADEHVGTGWSVLVYGPVEQTWRSEELRSIQALGLFSWTPGTLDRILRIFPTRITGRQIVL